MSTVQSTPEVKLPVESRHSPELDGVRGLAILGVLLAHGVLFLGVMPDSHKGRLLTMALVPGWGGVDLFFTLSGFLITGILLRARKRPRYFSSFYMRRILRIFPIYYLFLILTVVLVHFAPTISYLIPTGFRLRLSYFFYLQNWPVFWSSWAGLTTLWGAFWSLAVEEQFYMIWPTVIRYVNLRTVALACIAGFLLGWPERAYMMHRHPDLFGVMQWPFSRLDGMLLGASIAIYKEIRGRAVPLSWAISSFIAGAAVFAWILLFHSSELVAGNGFDVWGIGVTGYALMSGGLIAATQHRVKWLHRVLTIRPLLVLGRLSYGMYVYHLTIYMLIISFQPLSKYKASTSIISPLIWIACSILLVTGVAELSFQCVETPFLKLKRFFPSPAAPVV
ncbi:MAG TPA: acyltransferase [Acidobacteriaceae bacterium]